MRAIGYVRVSTDRQAEEGLGLEVQEQALRAWCKAGGHRLVAIVRDEGVSGTLEADKRPGLAEALALIADGQAEALVVHRLDRLARLLTVQEAVLAQVWQNSGRVFTIDAGEVLEDDPDDPMRTAMRQMRGVFHQLDRAMIAARLRAGRRLKAARGGFAYGSPPFGARSKDRELVSEPTEGDAIAYARELRRKGASYRAICVALTEAGHRPRRSDRWHPQVVARILARQDGRGAASAGAS